MKCYYCGAPLDETGVCPACGEDVRIWKRVCAISNRLYNDGLDRARVRDLSGAISSLRLSLRYNKANVPARNLLGLVYYETGDSVAAVSEWAISRSMDEDDNPAVDLIAQVQEDAGHFREMNLSLKKYNQSLAYCRDGNYDLALIQLKKVVTQNPKLVKGQQLLALLYMEADRYDLAMRCLRQAERVDADNTQTLSYMQECHRHLRHRRREEGKREENPVTYESEGDLIIRPAKFTDNSTARTVTNLIIGAAVGVAFVCLLVVPAVRQRANTNAVAQVVETDQSLAVRTQTVETLQAELDALNEQIRDVADANESASERTQTYQNFLKAYQYYMADDYAAAGTALDDVNRTLLDAEEQELYDSMREETEAATLESTYNAGLNLYEARDFEGAITQFLKVVDAQIDYENGQAAYFLAFAYNYTDDYANAIKWFHTTEEYATSQSILATARNMAASLEAEGYTAAR